jgi:hypothetical protein
LRTHETLQFLNAKPNPGHYAISNISKAFNINVMFVFYWFDYLIFRTQNIDRLHHKTPLCESHIVEIHGRLGYYKWFKVIFIIFYFICSACKDCENNYHKYIDYVDFGSLALPGMKFVFLLIQNYSVLYYVLGTSFEENTLMIQPPCILLLLYINISMFFSV